MHLQNAKCVMVIDENLPLGGMRNGWMFVKDIKRVEIVVYGIITIAAIFYGND